MKSVSAQWTVTKLLIMGVHAELQEHRKRLLRKPYWSPERSEISLLR